jgi:hypothetical protein
MHKIEWLNQLSFTPIPEKCQSPPRRDPGQSHVTLARNVPLGMYTFPDGSY